MSERKNPGSGFAERRSRVSRKISVTFDNATLDALTAEARRAGVSTGQIIRERVTTLAAMRIYISEAKNWCDDCTLADVMADPHSAHRAMTEARDRLSAALARIGGE